MYKILWNHGTDGWSLDDDEFSSAEDALETAMSSPTSEFKIIKIVEFVDKERV